jgi:hypothetical protein
VIAGLAPRCAACETNRMTVRVVVGILGAALVAAAGCSGGGTSSTGPPVAQTTTQSIASGTLTAVGTNNATFTMTFRGTLSPDETATVTSAIPAEVMALETGHVVGAGFTVTLGPQPVSVVLDRCAGGFSGGSLALSSQNIVYYDASASPPSAVATVAPVGPHQVAVCTSPAFAPVQTLLPARSYVVVVEI